MQVKQDLWAAHAHPVTMHTNSCCKMHLSAQGSSAAAEKEQQEILASFGQATSLIECACAGEPGAPRAGGQPAGGQLQLPEPRDLTAGDHQLPQHSDQRSCPAGSVCCCCQHPDACEGATFHAHVMLMLCTLKQSTCICPTRQ